MQIDGCFETSFFAVERSIRLTGERSKTVSLIARFIRSKGGAGIEGAGDEIDWQDLVLRGFDDNRCLRRLFIESCLDI